MYLTDEQLLVQDLEAEQRLLGSILFDISILKEIENPKASWFNDSRHATIFSCLLGLLPVWEADPSIDVSEHVYQSLVSRGVDPNDAIGQIAEIAQSAHSPVLWRRDLRKVLALRDRREVLLRLEQAGSSIRQGKQNWKEPLAGLFSDFPQVSPTCTTRSDSSELMTTRMSDIQIQPVLFLVPGVVPRGKLVTIAGLGGTGKGVFWSAMAADLTQGRPCLGLDYDPLPACDVLLLGCEDSASDTIKPRLAANGADVRRIHILDGVRNTQGNLVPFSLAHLAPLDTFLENAPDVALVVIDPITGYIGRAGVKDHHDAELRSVLEPLADLASRRGVTILAIKHLNKDEAKTVASRVGGSVAYVNVPRACFAIANDPENENRRVLAPFKWNLNVPRPRSHAWTLEAAPSDRVSTVLAECGHLSKKDLESLGRQLFRVVWQGPCDVSADDLLRNVSRVERTRSQNEIEKATVWLAERLKNGPVGSILCAKEGDEAIDRAFPDPMEGLPRDEHEKRVLGRVRWWRETILKRRLGGETKRAGFNGPYLFRLPGSPWPPPHDVIEDAVRAADSAIPLGPDSLGMGLPVESVVSVESANPSLPRMDSTMRIPRGTGPESLSRGIRIVEPVPLKGDSTDTTDSTDSTGPMSGWRRVRL
jgi:hypothetical protein